MPPIDHAAIEVLLADEEPTTNLRLAATLPPDATAVTLPVEHRPQQGEEILAAIRLIDAEGRPAAVSRWRRLRRVGEALHALPPPPLYPNRADWPIRIEQDIGELVLLLPALPARLGYSAIALERLDEAGGVISIKTWDASQASATLTEHTPLLQEAQRFRWRLTTQLGDALVGPWSAAAEPVFFTTTFDGVNLGGYTS